MIVGHPERRQVDAHQHAHEAQGRERRRRARGHQGPAGRAARERDDALRQPRDHVAQDRGPDAAACASRSAAPSRTPRSTTRTSRCSARELLLERIPSSSMQRYKLKELPADADALLDEIGRSAAASARAGTIDRHKAADVFIHEFRTGATRSDQSREPRQSVSSKTFQFASRARTRPRPCAAYARAALLRLGYVQPSS